ncbi:MAG: M20/M25/M40 family metallo-hydrolase [Acidobacteria bacterium]|nr:M20/M25/M40 family metallo-hydrolase [Acidobacteriota bacterium]
MRYSDESSDVVRLLQELIRNACINTGDSDSGDEWKSVATLAEFFGRSGTVIEPSPGRQSVVYRVRGHSSEAPTLMLLPHLDVVPVSEDGWLHNPFDAEIRDGVVWGRGAVDMLNVTAAMAAVFRPYLVGDIPPLAGDLVFAAVADEESGGVFGAENLVENHWDLVSCDYLLTEVAAPTLTKLGSSVLPVTAGEKGTGWRILSVRGTPSHASQPFGADNAVVPLAESVVSLASTPTPVSISEEWTTFVDALDLDVDVAMRLKHPDTVDEAIDDLAETDPLLARWAHASTHMTVAPTTLTAGTKTNTIADFGTASVDIRLLPGQSQDDADSHLRKAMGETVAARVDIERASIGEATLSMASGLLWEAIGDAAQEHIGSRALVPMTSPVATDARFFRRRGVTSYGVGWFDDEAAFSELLSMFHGHNERVRVTSVNQTTAFLSTTVERFGARTSVLPRQDIASNRPEST